MQNSQTLKLIYIAYISTANSKLIFASKLCKIVIIFHNIFNYLLLKINNIIVEIKIKSPNLFMLNVITIAIVKLSRDKK